MPSQSAAACLMLLILAELMRTGAAAQALALALALILTLAAHLLLLELDALGALLLSTYAAVFIFLALLSAHFGPFTQRAARQRAHQTTVLGYGGVLLGSLGFYGFNTNPAGTPIL